MKYFFLSSRDSAIADPGDPLLPGLRAAVLAKPGSEEADSPGSADAIIVHEKFSFKEWRYIGQLLSDPVIGRQPHKVYTVNGDDAANGLLKGVYTSLVKSRWRAGLHRAVHYTYWPNKSVLVAVNVVQPGPRCLAAWAGNTKSNRRLRGRIIQLFRHDSDFFLEPTDSWLNHGPNEQQRFVDTIRAAKFALCPAGWSASTFRIYESMALGVCPVIIADDFLHPEGPDWKKCSLQVRERDLPRLKEILAAEESTWAERGEQARKEWLRYFSPAASMEYYADQLALCIRARPGAGNREEEIARWRSFRTHWANHWTVPQRARVMLRKQIERGARGVRASFGSKLAA